MTRASLRLRGRDGPLIAALAWPPVDPEAVLVFVDDGEGEAACRSLGETMRAVTLSVRCATEHDVSLVVEWTADHAEDLGAAPGRIALAGHGAGADLAVAALRGAGLEVTVADLPAAVR